jgi:hypothetical protein
MLAPIVDFPQIAAWQLDRGPHYFKKICAKPRTYIPHSVLWCVRLTHPWRIPHSSLSSSGNAAALSIYGDVF